MKIQFKLFALLLCVAATSCSPTSYFQIHRVDSPNADEITENRIKFEHDGFTVYYDFWSEYGDAGFVIHNKSDDNLYIDLSETFLIKNGFAYDYFKNREYGSETSTALNYNENFDVDLRKSGNVRLLKVVNGGATVQNSSKIIRKEKDVIVIPAHSKKQFSEYNIVSSLVRDCDLPLVPKKRDDSVLRYKYEDSPIKFANVIAYSFDRKMTGIATIENKFYVSSIKNYREKDLKGNIDVSLCRDNPNKTIYTLTISPANSYFIKYPAPVNDKY